jgi:hypothetical protein
MVVVAVRRYAETLTDAPSRAHEVSWTGSTPGGSQTPAPIADFRHLKAVVCSARIEADTIERFRTSVRIEIENTHPTYKDDNFEFSPLTCELSDNFGNIYKPIASTDRDRSSYDRSPLYPKERRVIDVEFERPVSAVRWMELRMSPPSRCPAGGDRLRIGFPASFIEGLEKLGHRGPIMLSGCEVEDEGTPLPTR